MGNDVISLFTTSFKLAKYKLKFDLQSRNTSKWYYAEYNAFVVLPESHNYNMLVAEYSGNAGKDSLKCHSGQMFSTYDRDHDDWRDFNSAAVTGGGFWTQRCDDCAVNNDDTSLFYWSGLPGGRELQTSRMWLLCK